MAISDWSSTAGDNTSIDGINIAEGCSPANVNNALRAIMANVKADYDDLAVTTFIKSLLDDADADAARTTLSAVTLESLTLNSSNGSATLRFGTTRLIFKWGSAAHGDNTGIYPVTFATAFPNAGLFSIASNAASAPPTGFHGSDVPSTTGFNVYSSSAAGVASLAGTAFRWLAIGY